MMKGLLRGAVFALWIGAACAGELNGTLKDTEGRPVSAAEVALVELRRSAAVDKAGVFQFTEVPDGLYTLVATSDEFGSKLFRVTVTGPETHTELTIDLAVHEELIVTATPTQKSISDVAQAVGVLNKDTLIEKLEPTLGETLAMEPGVSSTYGGPAASRPVIRGLGGDRVAVLEGGMASGDISSVSGDHAVAIDPMTAERIEILRGPASLRYGSSAVGGAVNVVDNRIPELLPAQGLAGTVELRGGTVNDERGLGVALDGGRGKFAWHADFSGKDTHDLEIPGAAERETDEDHDDHEEEHVEGILENSSMENRKGAVGASYITDSGYFGVAFTALDSLYGVPGHGEHDHDHEGEKRAEEEEEGVRIDMRQRRIDLRGERRLNLGTFKTLNLRAGHADYEHAELEGDAVGTVFQNETFDVRGELLHEQLGPFTSGSLGAQFSDRDFSAAGEEAFVPPNQTDHTALFVYQEHARDFWTLVLGGRLERQNSHADLSAVDHDHEHEGEEAEEEEDHDADAVSLSYTTFSTSAGVILGGKRPYSLAINLSRTERAPNPEELFSNGPHLATGAFEMGSLDLDSETSLGADISLRKKEGVLTGELNLFSNRFDQFIYERYTGEEVDGLNEYVFSQEDADFYGGELHLDATLIHTEPHHLHLEMTYDLVRAELENGGYLPRITPDRLTVGLEYQRPSFHAGLSAHRSFAQERTAVLETDTPAYTFWDASLGYHFFTGTVVHNLALRGTNLTDEEGRAHTSFFKDRTLLPGRNLAFTWRLSF